jgi:hypothetical protein
MSTGTDTTAPRALDNNSLADALVTLAGLLRLHPQLPPVFSVSVAPANGPQRAWQAQLHPTTSVEEQAIDAVRTFAAAFGPDATLHLDPPRATSGGGTYRHLAAHATRTGIHLEAWTFIARTPADPNA